MSSDNPIEREFLDRYMEGHPYTDQLFNQYYHYHINQHPTEFFSLNINFAQIMEQHASTVTDEQFHNVFNRFTYLSDGLDDLLWSTDCSHQLTGLWMFTRGQHQAVVGQIGADGHIYNQTGELIAHRVGSFNSFHDNTVSCLFAGIWNELIAQMPEQYRTSNHQYYFTVDIIGQRYQVHLVTINLYQRPLIEAPQAAPTEAPQAAPTVEELCQVCLERPPETTVLPCHHHVVCRQCSNRLKTTNDHHTCLQCRRPIEQIIDDGSIDPMLNLFEGFRPQMMDDINYFCADNKLVIKLCRLNQDDPESSYFIVKSYSSGSDIILLPIRENLVSTLLIDRSKLVADEIATTKCHIEFLRGVSLEQISIMVMPREQMDQLMN